MRLCAVSFKECWQDAGGTWRANGGFPLQMSAIASLFDDATLLVTRGAPRKGGIAIAPSIRVVAMDPLPGRDLRRKWEVVKRSPYYLSTIARTLSGADVVHTPLPGDIPLLAMVVALLRGKRVLGRYGGSWGVNGTTTLANRLTRALMRLAARGENVMIAAGESAPEKRITPLFSTALSASELAKIPAGTARGLSDPPELVAIGRLSPEKGHDVLLEALALLRKRGVVAWLTLVGEGPEHRALRQLVVRLDLEGQVRFTGALDRDGLSAECARADVCVHPSRTESFCKAWLDAMAHGLPIVGTDVGSARQVIGASGERGWLVPPDDAEALAARLARVLTEPRDWPAIRTRCRRFTEERTLEAWARRIGEICAARWGWTLREGKLRA